jgi:CheY-like chemotaxis protein
MAKTNNQERDIILFVDDEKICHTLIDLIIPNFTKYKIVNAYNGEEAITLAKRYENNICLILSDIMLPDINGYQIYSLLKKDPKLKNIPFVFQSGLASQEDELRDNIKEKVDIIYKPYKQSDIINIITKLLEKEGE